MELGNSRALSALKKGPWRGVNVVTRRLATSARLPRTRRGRLGAVTAVAAFLVLPLVGALGASSATSMPVVAADPGGRSVLSAGNEVACAVDADGVLNCWGRQDSGVPILDAVPSGTFSVVSVAWSNACAINTAGSALCWGAATPIVAGVPAGSFTAISVGLNNACALRPDGTAQCWGSTASGINAPPATELTGIGVSNTSACGIAKTDGSVICWGTQVPSFRQPIPSGPFATVQSSVDFSRYCGIRTDGSLACWGMQVTGSVPMPTTGSYTSVAQADGVGCAVRSDGQLVCWGLAAAAEYTAAPTSTPVTLVSGRLSGMVAILAADVMRPWGSTRASFNAPIIQPSYPRGSVGTPFSRAFDYNSYTHTPEYHHFQVLSGSLPPGLTMDPASGSLRGTPTAAGSYTFTVGADSGASPIAPGSATVTIDPPVIAALSLDPATATIAPGQTQPYTVWLTTASGYHVTDVTALSATTLTIDDGTCGTGECTSTALGERSVRATYPSGSGGTYSAQATLTVFGGSGPGPSPSPTPTVTPTPTPTSPPRPRPTKTALPFPGTGSGSGGATQFAGGRRHLPFTGIELGATLAATGLALGAGALLLALRSRTGRGRHRAGHTAARHVA